MNSYERVFARLNGEPVDRIPNLCLVMTFAAREIEVPYRQFITDYRLLSEGMLRCCEKYHLDVLSVCSDPMREASGFGAEVVYPENDVPYSPVPLLSGCQDISRLKVKDPASSRRMNDRLEAVRLLKHRSGGEIPIVGWVEGALAESCDLMDISSCLCEMLDEPEAMHELLAICLEQGILFAREQLNAGADIIGIGDAASSLIGPDLYSEFALPYQQKLISEIHRAGGKAKLHICGDITPVLHLTAQTGADIIDLDHMVDLKKACGIFPETNCPNGNFDPVQILLQGDINSVGHAVRECLACAGMHRTMISAGCEVPAFTPPDNLREVHHVLSTY
ncbi:MAG: uroporphyrinogen decarboxylase family protein [Clostridium sp.]|nr:uroporphyrinogen decarboxylase family protein [Clostridium sp.]MDU7708368.1 uroporphyrinogen decarboxylase family protein [Clostridium sp.]